MYELLYLLTTVFVGYIQPTVTHISTFEKAQLWKPALSKVLCKPSALPSPLPRTLEVEYMGPLNKTK